MAKGFKHGAGGGAGFNFKVVGNPKPENPKENTIWVNTDEKITGWDFSATKPEAPEEGMVCFITNQASLTSFNALKKNGIQVCPFICYQYISGEWVRKDAEIYQIGAWNPIVSDLWLYNAGDECIDATGGWEVYRATYDTSGSGWDAPTLTRGATKISVASGCGTLRTVNKIDLSHFSIIEFDGTLSKGQYGGVRFCIWSEAGSSWLDNIAAEISPPFNGKTVLDISGLDGEFYVGAGVFMNEAYAEIRSIQLKV